MSLHSGLPSEFGIHFPYMLGFLRPIVLWGVSVDLNNPASLPYLHACCTSCYHLWLNRTTCKQEIYTRVYCVNTPSPSFIVLRLQILDTWLLSKIVIVCLFCIMCYCYLVNCNCLQQFFEPKMVLVLYSYQAKSNKTGAPLRHSNGNNNNLSPASVLEVSLSNESCLSSSLDDSSGKGLEFTVTLNWMSVVQIPLTIFCVAVHWRLNPLSSGISFELYLFLY